MRIGIYTTEACAKQYGAISYETGFDCLSAETPIMGYTRCRMLAHDRWNLNLGGYGPLADENPAIRRRPGIHSRSHSVKAYSTNNLLRADTLVYFNSYDSRHN